MVFLRKIGYALLVLLGVALVVFALFMALGDPARMMTGQRGDAKTLENIRKELYLDQPKWKQCLLYLNDLSPISVQSRQQISDKHLRGFFWGDEQTIGIKWPYLRTSYQTKKNVGDILLGAIPGTLLLTLTAMLFAFVAGVGLGIVAALKKGTWLDTGALLTSVAGISAPSFFVALVVAYLFGLVWHPFTGLPLTGSWLSIDEVTGEQYWSLRNLILPAFTLGIRPLAMIMQLTRSSMLEVLQEDYIRTAKAKGLPKRKIIFKHALPNALNPVVTAVTGWMGELMAGAFFIEYIFGWQGLGKVTVDALEQLDYPVVMGSTLFSACIFLGMNGLADSINRRLDPRIR